MSETRLRKARKQHQCTERSYHLIDIGELYLCCIMPPWHEFATRRGWRVIRACLRCAKEFGLHTSETAQQASGEKP